MKLIYNSKLKTFPSSAILNNFHFVLFEVYPKFFVELDLNRQVGTYGSALPFENYRHHISFHALKIEGLIAMFGMVVNNDRFLDANAIANFHSFEFSVISLTVSTSTDAKH